MNFKKPKKDVVNEVYYRVDSSLRSSFYSSMGPNGPFGMYGPGNQGPVLEALMYAMTAAITEAVSTVIENTYTDAEFEEDIGLKDKDPLA